MDATAIVESIGIAVTVLGAVLITFGQFSSLKTEVRNLKEKMCGLEEDNKRLLAFMWRRAKIEAQRSGIEVDESP